MKIEIKIIALFPFFCHRNSFNVRNVDMMHSKKNAGTAITNSTISERKSESGSDTV